MKAELEPAAPQPGSWRRRGGALDRWIVQNAEVVPNHLTTMRLDYDLITGVLTRERIRLVNWLRDHGPVASLQELADGLGRDKAAVSRDVSHLEGSLVEVERKGRRLAIRAPDRLVILY